MRTRGHPQNSRRPLLKVSTRESFFSPDAEKENSVSAAVVKCASFEPATTANEEGTFKAGSVPRESVKTLQQFSGLQGCTFNFYLSKKFLLVSYIDFATCAQYQFCCLFNTEELSTVLYFP